MPAVIIALAGITADAPTTTTTPTPTLVAVPIVRPDLSPEGYVYGQRGSHLQKAAVISRLDILDDPDGGQVACINIRKGPEYAAIDPHINGYPGCSLLGALTGAFFEDTDSAQVVICWKDRQHQTHVADNLVAGPTLGRAQAALWDWADDTSLDAACVRLPIGKDAVELTALVVYTDVCYAYSDEFGPEDGPAVIASWDAVRKGGIWQVLPRDEVGLGASPDMEEPVRIQAAIQVRNLIQQRTGNRYTLKDRYNIGQKPDPANPLWIIQYDSGYDIVPARYP